MGSIVDTTDKSFDRLFNINVRAAFQLFRESTRRMSKNIRGGLLGIVVIAAGWETVVNLLMKLPRPRGLIASRLVVWRAS